MKWLGLFEMDSKDVDVNIKKYQEALASREKGEQRFPKQVFESHVFVGKNNGVVIYDEGTTTEQLINISLHFKDTVKWEFKPIVEASKSIEIYLKTKK